MPGVRLLLLLISLWATATAGARVAEYSIRVEANLERMHVHARFSDPAMRIGARSRDAGEFLMSAHDCDDDATLSHRGRRLETPPTGIRCLTYVVDLARAAQADSRNRGLAESNIVVAPADWFWRPVDGAWSTTVHFELEPGHAVSVPWLPVGEDKPGFRPSPSPQSGTAPAAFGQFTSLQREIPGAILRIAMLAGNSAYDPVAIADRIASSAENVTLVYGRFPHPSPQIVALPSGARAWGDPVYFGRVVRDGGETVELLINEGLPPAAFDDDWTATHEFSHLMLPYIDRDFRWVSEGFAQYYQNLLLARAGTYSEQEAWQKIIEGFERGRRSLPGVSPNDAARIHDRGGRMKIYWTGAALALIADVQLRNSGAGRSLDAALGELQSCCLPSGRTWSAEELFSQLDELADDAVFLPLYREISVSGEFPDVEGLLHKLGITIRNGQVVFDESAPLSALRRELTAPPADAVATVLAVY